MRQSAQLTELMVSGAPGPPERPRRWVLPTVVVAAAVAGAAAVPMFIALSGPSAPATETVAATGRAASSVAATTQAAQPSVAAAAPAPTRAPRASLALATPVPPSRVHVPSPISRSPSLSPSPGGSSSAAGERTGSLDPSAGPAGRLVTLSGHCLPGSDVRYTAGTAGAARQKLPADGSFTVRLPAGGGAGAGSDVPLAVQCLDATGAVTFRKDLSYHVTVVVEVPGQLPGDAGSLDGAPQSGTVGDTVRVSGSGFMPGAPVAYQVRNADSGQAAAAGQQLADGGGAVYLTVKLPEPGPIQIVAAGVDPGGGPRVLVATVTAAPSG